MKRSDAATVTAISTAATMSSTMLMKLPRASKDPVSVQYVSSEIVTGSIVHEKQISSQVWEGKDRRTVFIRVGVKPRELFHHIPIGGTRGDHREAAVKTVVIEIHTPLQVHGNINKYYYANF